MANRIWIASDLHLNHNQPFIYETRGYKSIEEMNEGIIANFNSVVNEEDDVYILGDCGLGNDTEKLGEMLSRFNGKLHIILGNHDTTPRITMYKSLPNVVQVEYGLPLTYKKYHFWLSHYPSLCGNYDDEKPLRKRVINLCGHSHVSNAFIDMDKGLIYHCELEAHNNFPILLDDIITEIKGAIQ